MGFVLVATLLVLPRTVTIRVALPVGATFRYRQTVDLRQEGGPDGGSGPMQLRTEVERSLQVLAKVGGKTTLVTTPLSGKVLLPPNSVLENRREALERALSTGAFQLVVDAQGRVKANRPLGGNGQVPSSLQTSLGASPLGFQGVPFPTKPVRVGESWTTQVDFRSSVASQTKVAGDINSEGVMPVTTTLVELNRSTGRTLARLQFRTTGQIHSSMGSRKAVVLFKGAGQAWVDVESGLVETGIYNQSMSFSAGPTSFVVQLSTASERL